MYTSEEQRKAAIRQIEARLAVQPATDDPKAMEVVRLTKTFCRYLKTLKRPRPRRLL